MFPPVNSGGLIEALIDPVAEFPPTGFPPVNSGGLIEAEVTVRRADVFMPEFPPVNSGGLIEARVDVE